MSPPPSTEMHDIHNVINFPKEWLFSKRWWANF